MLGSGTVQLAVKVAHEYLNAHSLVVSAGPLGPRFRLNGDHTLLACPAGALRAAEAAAASRRAIAELLRDGETSIDSWDIFDRFPDHVEQGGQTGLAPAMAPGGTAGPVLRAVRAAIDASAAQPHVRRLRTACAAHRRRLAARPVFGAAVRADRVPAR